MVAQGAISVNLKRGRGPLASLESLLGKSPSGAGALVLPGKRDEPTHRVEHATTFSGKFFNYVEIHVRFARKTPGGYV